MFSEGVSMKIDGGDDTIKSCMGTLCSLLLLVVIGAYAYVKLGVFLIKKEANILSAIEYLWYTDDDKFSYESGGMNIAVAFSSYNDEKEWELDPTYGELFFNSYSWGADEDGKQYKNRTRLPDHNCSRKELHLEDDDSEAKFY